MKPEPGLYSMETISRAAADWRREGLEIVFTNGCFDLLHPGHVRYLQQACDHGDLLVLGLNTDDSIQRLKGPGRPILRLEERIEVLLALRSVTAVVPFEDETPLELIRRVRPHVLVKGGDWTVDRIVGREVVLADGGEVLSLPLVQGVSTTDIIERIRSVT